MVGIGTYSISFTLGKASAAHGANVAHNNRKYLADNVNPAQTFHNVNYKMQQVENAYQELFGEAVAEYNAQQTRPCRRITDYYTQIANGHREEAFYEIIVQLGDCQTVPIGSVRWKAACAMLNEYMKCFEQRNPNLHIFNASLHLDEASPHLHIDFIPFYTKERQRGLKKGVSMRAALIEQGFSPKPGKNQLEQWEESERNILESILHRHGFERENKNAHYKHLEISEYKSMQNTKRLTKQLRRMMDISETELSVDYVKRLKSELNATRHTVQRLEAEKQSPYQSFFYASDDKQSFVQQEMERRGIPYREAENGFEAQDCYLKEIREIEKSYRTPSVSYRNKLREDIDRMLLKSSSFRELFQNLADAGYRIKTGKYISVKPFASDRFIRLKSLGEEYSELALRNRMKNKLRFEKEISDKIEEATQNQAPNLRVLHAIRVYINAFVKENLPIHKRQPNKAFMWTNDAELDKILAFNKAIKEGKTLESIRNEFQELTEQEAASAKAIEETEQELQKNCELKECCDVVFNGKRPDAVSVELAQKYIANCRGLTRDNYRNLIPMIHAETRNLQEAKEHHEQIREQLKKAADQLDVAEKIFGGTYVQHLVSDIRIKRHAEMLPSGYYRSGGMIR